MRITSLTIKNFKGIDEHGVRIEFAPITLLFGPNNAGKSTILHALLYAREVLTKGNADPDYLSGAGGSTNLGGFYNFVHKHDTTRSIYLRLDFEIDEMPEYFIGSDMDNILKSFDIIELFASIRNIGVECLISYNDAKKRAFFDSYTIYINGKKFCYLKLNHELRHVVFSGCNALCLINPFDELDFLLSIKDALTLSEGERSKIIESAIEKYRNAIPDLLKTLHRDDYLFDGTIDAAPDIAGEFIRMQNEISFAFTRGLPFDWHSIIPISIDTLEGVDEDFAHIGQVEFYDLQRSVLSSLILGPGKLLTEELERLLYVGPLRAIPPRNFQPACSPDINRWANGLAVWDIISQTSDSNIEKLNSLLHSDNDNSPSLNIGYLIKRKHMFQLDEHAPLTAALRQLLLEDDFDEISIKYLREFLSQKPQLCVKLSNVMNDIELEPYDMGVGISQVLPIVASSVFAHPNSLVVVEQPELHIHPKIQVALGDIFIYASTGKEDAPMFLLETHSEHLLLRMLRRIRQTTEGSVSHGLELTPSNLAINWIGNEEGRTTVLRIEVAENGTFNTLWPEGFFEERGVELFE